MFLDISIEYNACYEEYIGDNVLKISNGPLQVSYHTEVGKNYLDSCGVVTSGIHKRTPVPNKLGRMIRDNMSKNNVNGSWGGFYWLNKHHTKHVGE